MWGQYQGTEFKKIETLQEKAIRIIKFLPSNAPVSKEMQIKNSKPKRLYHTSKHTFCIWLPWGRKNEKLQYNFLYWGNVYQAGTCFKML